MTDPAPNHDQDHPFFEAMREQFIATPLPAGRRLRLGGQRPRARRRILRPLPLAGVAMGLAVAIAAVVIVLGAGGADPAPAYAVTLNNTSITIDWREWSAIGKLNARLSMLHMRIRVVPVIQGCVAPVHHVIYAQADSDVPTHIAPGPARTLEVSHVSAPGAPRAGNGRGQGGVLTTFNDTLPGRTRIFTATKSGGWNGGLFTVVGPAPHCVGDSR